MKKIIALLLVLAMVACLFVGCGEKEAAGSEKPADSGTSEGGDTASNGGDTYKIIYLTPSTASDFWSQVETGIQQAMKDYQEELGITIEYEVMGPAEESDAEG